MKKSIKSILYLRTDFSDEKLIGGSIAHLKGVVNGFARIGINVICAAPFVMDHIDLDFGIKKIFLRRPPLLPRFLWRITCFLGSLWYPVQLRKVFKRQSFNVIYYRYAFMDLTAVFLKWMFKIPIVMEYNGSESWIDEKLRPKEKIKFIWLSRLVERTNLKYANSIIVVSQALKDELMEKGVYYCKILVNPNGVDHLVFDPEKFCEERKEIRENLNIQNKIVFSFVGSFSQWHGIDIMSQIIPPILKACPNAHFLLVGDGLYRAGMKKSLQLSGVSSQSVEYTGMVSHNKVRHYLAASDICLLPAQKGPDNKRYFCSPIKLFEYMSMAKPVIASNLEQISTVLSPSLGQGDRCEIQDHVGCVVAHDDVDAFVKKACQLATTQENVRMRMGENARQRIIDNYGWNIHVGNIISFIKLFR